MTDTLSRRIEYRPLSELTFDPRNPKTHDLDTIDASIGRFGVIDAIVVDGRTGYIVAGHGRTKTLTAMRDRGETPPEGVTPTDAGDDWLVPVMAGWSSRTDSEASAALIALNRTTELGGWVDEELLSLLDDLSDLGEEGLLGVGFTEADHEALARLSEFGPVSGGRDLDELYDEVGDLTEDDKLVPVRLNLTPATAAQLKTVLADYASHEEAVQAWLL